MPQHTARIGGNYRCLDTVVVGCFGASGLSGATNYPFVLAHIIAERSFDFVIRLRKLTG